ncbi:hypothetical protein AB4090_07635 [Acidithiobacillus sp. IBUN Pt1247-S3]|uniref:hypothetical protein n=1 Tax=Acidithiobacillus sp. IBUN Pt1247-S3 TaxID=3166642 RepID=UPI0034E4AA00
MAASHETNLEMPLTGKRLEDYLAKVAKTLSKTYGWKIDQQTQDSATFRVGLNLLSWGERVTIQVNNGTITIRSECRFPLQIFDWGKNRANNDTAGYVIKQCLSASA